MKLLVTAAAIRRVSRYFCEGFGHCTRDCGLKEQQQRYAGPFQSRGRRHFRGRGRGHNPRGPFPGNFNVCQTNRNNLN